MLDQLRRHATSWFIKALLALIILTFVGFFGWSRISDRFRDAQEYVAAVGGQGIPRRKYDNMVQTSLDRLRKNISGNLPANMEELLKNNVLNQLISQELVVQYAKDLGLRVSDEEVAQYIRNNTGLFADGKFNLQIYEKRFLPSYRRRNGEDFEDAVRRDLLVEKMETLVMTLYSPWEKELDTSIDEHLKAAPKKDKHAHTKTAKKKEPESEPLAPSVTSASPLDLFTDWVQDFRQKAKITTY